MNPSKTQFNNPLDDDEDFIECELRQFEEDITEREAASAAGDIYIYIYCTGKYNANLRFLFNVVHNIPCEYFALTQHLYGRTRCLQNKKRVNGFKERRQHMGFSETNCDPEIRCLKITFDLRILKLIVNHQALFHNICLSSMKEKRSNIVK